MLEVAGLLERIGCRRAGMGLVHTVEEVGELVVVQDGSWLWFLRMETEMFHSCWQLYPGFLDSFLRKFGYF